MTLSGYQRRKLRVEAGLPRYSGKEAESRKQDSVRRVIERRKALAAWLSEHKVEAGCADCGYRDHPAALEFDHLPGFEKAASINVLLNRAVSKARLMEEMAKCEVVCANCHRIRTAARAGESDPV